MALPVLGGHAGLHRSSVFLIPVTFALRGKSRYLFIALAVAVMLSLFASYLVALTVVPSFCAYFIKAGEDGSTITAKRSHLRAAV